MNDKREYHMVYETEILTCCGQGALCINSFNQDIVIYINDVCNINTKYVYDVLCSFPISIQFY